jgi:Flp pilus assembly protein TadG
MTRNSRLRRLATEEQGFSLIFVGLGCMAFIAASMLAIDVGMLMTARSQAQNSADAGALAGATALVFNDWTDRTASGPAVTNALNAARGNQVMGANVSVTAPDVEFLNDPSGVNNRVKVTV